MLIHFQEDHFSLIGRQRLEQDSQRGDVDDRRGRNEQVLLQKNERFERRLAAHDDHGHRDDHEAAEEDAEKENVAEELAGDVFAGSHGRRGDDGAAARLRVAADGVGDDVEAAKADEECAEDRGGHADGRGVVERARPSDLHQRGAASRIGNPEVRDATEDQEQHRGRRAPEADQHVRARPRRKCPISSMQYS